MWSYGPLKWRTQHGKSQFLSFVVLFRQLVELQDSLGQRKAPEVLFDHSIVSNSYIDSTIITRLAYIVLAQT